MSLFSPMCFGLKAKFLIIVLLFSGLHPAGCLPEICDHKNL